jgi:glycosyltransferase involved in cell wall biosynthesis
MRLVWIKVGGLWPLNTGGRLRTFQILSELSAAHDVALLTTHAPGEDPDGLANGLGRTVRILSLPYAVAKQGSRRFAAALARSWLSRDPVDLRRWRVPGARRVVREWLDAEPWDVMVADFMVAAANLPRGGPPVVYFAHNVEHQIWRRLATVERGRLRRLALELEWRKMRRREAAMLRAAAVTVAVSEADRQTLLDLVPDARIEVVPTGVDTTFFRPAGAAVVPRRLVFSGSMDWYPNEDAILDFGARIWPRLRAAHHDISMTVVGRNPGPRIIDLGARSGITVTGTVDDVRPYLDEAEIAVVPLRAGGGTRLKIFEALAMRKPVVSTTIGAEGLGLVDGRHFVAADGPAAFAAAIDRLFGDPRAREALGEAGRALVEADFGWPQVARHFAHALHDATGSPLTGVPLSPGSQP